MTLFGMIVRVFTNGPGDLGSIPGWLIPKTQKMVLSNIRYDSRVKWSNPGKRLAPFPTPWCSSCWKGSLRVTYDYGSQLSFNWYIGQVGRVFANGPGDLDSNLGRVIPKIFKMVLDTSLLNTQQYKVRNKGKVEQFRERSSALPYITM